MPPFDSSSVVELGLGKSESGLFLGSYLCSLQSLLQIIHGRNNPTQFLCMAISDCCIAALIAAGLQLQEHFLPVKVPCWSVLGNNRLPLVYFDDLPV